MHIGEESSGENQRRPSSVVVGGEEEVGEGIGGRSWPLYLGRRRGESWECRAAAAWMAAAWMAA